MPEGRRPIAVSNPLFKVVLIFVAVLCAACLIALALLAIWARDPMTKAQENLSSICMHGFMTTLALFIGLAGGRAAQPDYMGNLPTEGTLPAAASRTARRPPEPKA